VTGGGGHKERDGGESVAELPAAGMERGLHRCEDAPV
jgi:hypothetical protein